MNRRDFLTGLLACSAAVVAAEFGAPEWMGEDIKLELAKDLNKTVVGFSDISLFGDKPTVWYSVAGVRDIWAKEVAKQFDYTDIGYDLNMRIQDTCYRMAKEIDNRLAKGEVAFEKNVIVDTPKVQNVKKNFNNEISYFELACGVEQKINPFGEDRIRVGYLQNANPKLVDQHGRELSV
jgi:hypothetical protein